MLDLFGRYVEKLRNMCHTPVNVVKPPFYFTIIII